MDIMKAYPDGSVSFARLRCFTPDPLPPRQPLNRTNPGNWFRDELTPEQYQNWASSLGLSTLANSHSPARAQRGTGGITSHGRRLVRFGAADLQRVYGVSRLSFITCTLPEAFVSLGRECWAEAVRQFVQSVKRELVRQGLPSHVVGVTEVQEARMDKFGGCPLHLHLVVVGKRPKGRWALTPEWIRDKWRNAVVNATGNDKEIKFDTSTRIERIHKSADGYIGKYMSKGCKVTRQVIDQGMQHLLPACWYVCSNGLRKLYQRNIRTFSGDDVKHVFDFVLSACLECFCYFKWVEVPGADGLPMKVAWTGRLKREWSSDQFCELLGR